MNFNSNVMFNKYAFIEKLRKQLSEAIESGVITDDYQINEYVIEEINLQCSEHYEYVLGIVNELKFFRWDKYADEINSISDVAFIALRNYIYENIDLKEIEELIKQSKL